MMFVKLLLLSSVAMFWIALFAIEARNSSKAQAKIRKEIASDGGRVHSITALNGMGNQLPFLVKFETEDGRLLQGTMYYLTKEEELQWVGSLTSVVPSTTPGFISSQPQQFEHLSQSHDWSNSADSKEQIISDLSAEIERLRSQSNKLAF